MSLLAARREVYHLLAADSVVDGRARAAPAIGELGNAEKRRHPIVCALGNRSHQLERSKIICFSSCETALSRCRRFNDFGAGWNWGFRNTLISPDYCTTEGSGRAGYCLS